MSGGVSNVILAHGTPDDVRRRCKEVIDIAARDGGYIMDASAIMQNDAKVENIKAMTDFTREYGVYSASGQRAFEQPASAATVSHSHTCKPGTRRPGVVTPWEEKRADAGHHRRPRPDPASLGRDRRSGEYVYLADSAVVLVS